MRDGFPKEQIIKVMLQVASRNRKLTKLESKYDKKFKDVSEHRQSEIISYLESNHLIHQVPVFIESPDPVTIKIFPFSSSDGEGLSPNGEDELRDLIDSFEQDRVYKRRKTLSYVIISIFIALVIAFLKGCLGLE